MINTCNEYAKTHNLKFSTDPNPVKSKTKCLAFTKEERTLEKLTLGDHPLPWITSAKHLGNTLENIINGLKKDIMIKRAKYIGRKNELEQEFYFAHPDTKSKLNRIYNFSFCGSPLWDFSSREFEMMENTYNVSVRLCYNLPRTTHRNLIEAVSETPHLRSVLIQRFLSFIDQVKNCPKEVAKTLLSVIEHDVRSVTGSNLRHIMKICEKDSFRDLSPNDAKSIKYHPLPDDQLWKADMIKEIVEVRSNNFEIVGFSHSDLNTIMDYLCTS